MRFFDKLSKKTPRANQSVLIHFSLLRKTKNLARFGQNCHFLIKPAEFNIIIYLRVLCRWRANMWLSRPFGNQWQCGAGGGAQSRQVQCHSLGQHQAGWEGGRDSNNTTNIRLHFRSTQDRPRLQQHSESWEVLIIQIKPFLYIFLNIELY